MRIKYLKKKLKLILIISFIILNFSNPIFARHYEKLEKIYGKATIAEPIIKVETLQDTIKTEINKESSVEEYNFSIKNYVIEENNKRINEVDFLYDIEIKNSNENFPIKYELYDVQTGEEVLGGNNKISRLGNFKKYRI